MYNEHVYDIMSYMTMQYRYVLLISLTSHIWLDTEVSKLQMNIYFAK